MKSNSKTPRTYEAAGYPSRDWQATANRLFLCSEKLELENAELLDALDSLITACELPGDHCEKEQAIRIAKVAIAKVKGDVS